MSKELKIFTALCPDCEEEMDLGFELTLGQKVMCKNCWAYLEVVNLEPPEVNWDPEVYEEFEESN